MLHKDRHWNLEGVDSPETLACMLTEFTWPLCQAMQLGQYIVANDSASAQAGQEYAMLRPDPDDCSWLIQVQYITLSWCTEAAATEILRALARGEYDLHRLDQVSSGRFASTERHGFGPLCI